MKTRKLRGLKPGESSVPASFSLVQTQFAAKTRVERHVVRSRGLSLPDETMAYVFSFLTRQEASSASATSQQFYSSAHERVQNLIIEFRQFGPKKFERFLIELQQPIEGFDPKIVHENIINEFEYLKKFVTHNSVREKFSIPELGDIKFSTSNYHKLRKMVEDLLSIDKALRMHSFFGAFEIIDIERMGIRIQVKNGNIEYEGLSKERKQELNQFIARAKLIREVQSLNLIDCAVKIGFKYDDQSQSLTIPENIKDEQIRKLNQLIEDENLIKAVEENLPQNYAKELSELEHHEKAEKIRQYLKEKPEEWGDTWNLEGKGLTRFPVELCRLVHIKILNLAHNKLGKLLKSLKI